MKGLSKILIMTPISSTVLMVSGCAFYPAHNDSGYHGQSPHSAAHGYRDKYQRHDIVYNASLGVYAIVGSNNYHYYDNNDYKHDHDNHDRDH